VLCLFARLRSFPGVNQRLNGKLSGQINGVDLSETNMHSFMLTQDGKAYTAVNMVPLDVSVPLMTMNTINGVIGWLFALRGSIDAKNGFVYTGNVYRGGILKDKLTPALHFIQCGFGYIF